MSWAVSSCLLLADFLALGLSSMFALFPYSTRIFWQLSRTCCQRLLYDVVAKVMREVLTSLRSFLSFSASCLASLTFPSLWISKLPLIKPMRLHGGWFLIASWVFVSSGSADFCLALFWPCLAIPSVLTGSWILTLSALAEFYRAIDLRHFIMLYVSRLNVNNKNVMFCLAAPLFWLSFT